LSLDNDRLRDRARNKKEEEEEINRVRDRDNSFNSFENSDSNSDNWSNSDEDGMSPPRERRRMRDSSGIHPLRDSFDVRDLDLCGGGCTHQMKVDVIPRSEGTF